MLNKQSRIADDPCSSRLGIEHCTNSTQHKEFSMLRLITKYRIGADFNQVRVEFNDRRTFIGAGINLLFLSKQRIQLPSEQLPIS
jgi:hypothetical protein